MEGVVKTNMEEQGAPQINKFKCFGPQNFEGYGFVIVQNNDESAIYKEKVTFTTFKGIKFL